MTMYQTDWEMIVDKLITGHPVVIPNFGKFYTVTMPAGVQHDPYTGKLAAHEPYRIIKFEPCEALRKAVKKIPKEEKDADA